MSAADVEHAAFCTERGNVCLDPETANLVFPQPPSWHVAAASEHLDDDAPWCRVQELAMEWLADDEKR